MDAYDFEEIMEEKDREKNVYLKKRLVHYHKLVDEKGLRDEYYNIKFDENEYWNLKKENTKFRRAMDEYDHILAKEVRDGLPKFCREREMENFGIAWGRMIKLMEKELLPKEEYIY
ncbi:hypothetical protein ACFL1H_04945 [Nanoarchaeota archaeon]